MRARRLLARGERGAEALRKLSSAATLDLVASFQRAVVDDLVTRTIAAAEQNGARTILVSGGVAANRELRTAFEAEAGRHNLEVFFPSRALSTDNAAMIAAAVLPVLSLARSAAPEEYGAECSNQSAARLAECVRVRANRQQLVNFLSRESGRPLQFSGVFFEVVERQLGILADLDEVAVADRACSNAIPSRQDWPSGSVRKTAPFGAPLLCNTPRCRPGFEKAARGVAIGRGFENDLWLIRRRATAGIENDPGVGQLDVAGIFRFDHFPAKNSHVEVLRFRLVLHSEEMRDVESFVGNRCAKSVHAAPPVKT